VPVIGLNRTSLMPLTVTTRFVPSDDFNVTVPPTFTPRPSAVSRETTTWSADAGQSPDSNPNHRRDGSRDTEYTFAVPRAAEPYAVTVAA